MVFLTTAADPSRLLQMTINRFPHYDVLLLVLLFIYYLLPHICI